MQANPGVTVNYAGGGSGKGLTDLQHKLVDFAGTDAPIPTSDLPKYGGAQAILYFPTVAAPITVSYNLSGRHQADPDRAPPSPGSSPARSRRGTIRRSPPTTRA